MKTLANGNAGFVDAPAFPTSNPVGDVRVHAISAERADSRAALPSLVSDLLARVRDLMARTKTQL